MTESAWIRKSLSNIQLWVESFNLLVFFTWTYKSVIFGVQMSMYYLAGCWPSVCIFFLTQNVPNVISLVSRLNYTKLTSFNVVLFCNVDDVKAVKDKVKEEGATDTQIGHFYVQNSPCRSESQGTYTVVFILVLHERNC